LQEQIIGEKNMKIEVGKIYKNNNGEIIKINSLEPVDDYPFLGDDGFYYTKTGNFYLETNCDLDLIEEVITGENMNDYEKTIEDLQSRVKALEERLTPCDGATAEPVKWSPVGGEWWIDGEGNVKKTDSSDETKEFGTERPTQQQAERAAIEMRKFNRLLALRDELCGDTVVDWNTREAKYFLCHNEESKIWVINTSFCQSINTIYFTTLESAKRACDMLNSGEVEL
jgi:hypothetical protein